MLFGPSADRRHGRLLTVPAAEPTRPAAESSSSPSAAGSIPESAVAWDPNGGHNHDGAVSRAIPLAGDLTGDNTDATVDHLQNVPVAAPATPADDDKFLQFDGANLVWSAVATTHNLLSVTHPDTTAGSVARGDLITGQDASPTWKKLPIGLSGRYLRSNGTDAAWGQVAFSELSGTLTDAQHGALSASSSHTVGGDISGTTAAATVVAIRGLSVAAPAAGDDAQFLRYNHATGYTWETPALATHALLSASHSDTLAAAVSRGSLIYGNSTPAWAELVIGAAGRVIKSDGTDLAWGQVAHSELSGVGANDHHNQAHSLTGSDHTLSSTEGHIGVVQSGGSTWALEAPGTHVIRAGTTAARPAATAVPAGTLYLSTDDDGGTLHRSTGAAWVQCGLGVSETPVSSVTHNLLSATHPDTTAASVSRGAIITGQGASPAWALLAAGTAGKFLTMGANEPAWGNLSGIATGDVTYTANAGKVTALHNLDVPDPTLYSFIGALAPAATSPLSWQSREFCVVGWARPNIQNATTGSLMPRTGPTGTIDAPWIPHRNGYLTGVSAATDGDVGTAGDVYTVEVYKNGSATGLTVAISGSTGTEDSNYTAVLTATYAFNAGDKIDLRDTETGSLAAVGAHAQFFAVWTGVI